MKHLKTLLLIFLISSCCYLFSLETSAPEVFVSERIEKVWETEQTLKIPESVCFDRKRNALYVSNINGQTTEMNGLGFISKLDLEGNILELKWIDNLNAPKGLTVYEEILYITDINRIIKYDIVKACIVEDYVIEGAFFLNDIIADKNGNIYATDTAGGCIYKLASGNVTKWVEGLIKPNGLRSEEKSLLVGTKDKILSIKIDDKAIKELVTNTNSIDGLYKFSENRYISSNWAGATFENYPEKEDIVLIDTTNLNINAADFEYIPEKHLIIIPTFYHDRVIAFKLK